MKSRIELMTLKGSREGILSYELVIVHESYAFISANVDIYYDRGTYKKKVNNEFPVIYMMKNNLVIKCSYKNSLKIFLEKIKTCSKKELDTYWNMHYEKRTV